MKRLFLFLFLLSFSGLNAQEELAKLYFNDGEFEKAVVFYEKLVGRNPRRTDYTEKLVQCYQQLEAYDKAIAMLTERVEAGTVYPTLLIDLGYTYRLKGQPEVSDTWYERALDAIEDNPNMGYGIGFKFQRYTLLEYALRAYRSAMALNPELDFNFQIARIYGEQGKIQQMFEAYMDLLLQRPSSKPNVLRVLEGFISSDPGDETNVLLRKVLLKRAQKSPNPLWNELLSWVFLQEGQYAAAFNQEKAIYRRSESRDLDRMFSLADVAESNGDLEAAERAFSFVVSEATEDPMRLNAQLHLVDIGLKAGPEPDLQAARRDYERLLDDYGYATSTLQLQVAFAKFLAFRLDEAQEGIGLLRKSLELPMSGYSEGFLKMTLGDLLVYDQQFNEALILYSQVQKRLKNDVIGQQARFKVAQTSFYKGDFEWALTQLKVLRNSTSQLIANDAMQLSLVISDNSLEDSTQTALKKFARADLLAYQQKNDAALEVLQQLLSEHKGEKIEDEALLKQGGLLEEAGDYQGALLSYRKIIEFYGNGILADDAYFATAELYRNRLGAPEKAMEHYQQIIFRYPDSYFFPQARRQFRLLRGDKLE